jgi:hypothetical protein
MSTGWPKFADMDWLRLLEGPGDLMVLPLAPTMKRLTYKGERYFRMPDARSTVRPGEDTEGLTIYGGAYLWDGWWETMLQKAMAEKADSSPAVCPVRVTP